MLQSRIAPTPSGYLHIGNLYNFVRTWLMVKQQQGKLLLRIDDIDNERTRPFYLQNIFDWLQALQLQMDEGPLDIHEFQTQWSQQNRLPLYEKTLHQLAETNLVYACQCSRKAIASTHSDGKVPCECKSKGISLYEKGIAWRLHIPQNVQVRWMDDCMGPLSFFPAHEMGDFVIRRRNGMPAYQVASLCDDIFFNINCIVRGEDLLPSTAVQLYMAELLPTNTFLQARFCHHALIKNESGEKLSKSAGSPHIATIRQQINVPAALQEIGQMLWPKTSLPQFNHLSELQEWMVNHPLQ